ncbi:hypothetical protein K490DRAFT_56799 [Saccharata proteae CBS 121410]|uniref:Uncharacterized protein n=1 Tax=Saccharata proteae CBS 121410 TaxID=1314787 RepID=A0A9P4HY49_9PEZI|nr:hypothetical protein K490DRAFT_56799 [Saccharata proteae CBS 121410]
MTRWLEMTSWEDVCLVNLIGQSRQSLRPPPAYYGQSTYDCTSHHPGHSPPLQDQQPDAMPSPPEPNPEEPGRRASTRARKPVATYNVKAAAGTQLHTPTKYLDGTYQRKQRPTFTAGAPSASSAHTPSTHTPAQPHGPISQEAAEAPPAPACAGSKLTFPGQRYDTNVTFTGILSGTPAKLKPATQINQTQSNAAIANTTRTLPDHGQRYDAHVTFSGIHGTPAASHGIHGTPAASQSATQINQTQSNAAIGQNSRALSYRRPDAGLNLQNHGTGYDTNVTFGGIQSGTLTASNSATQIMQPPSNVAIENAIKNSAVSQITRILADNRSNAGIREISRILSDPRAAAGLHLQNLEARDEGNATSMGIQNGTPTASQSTTRITQTRSNASVAQPSQITSYHRPAAGLNLEAGDDGNDTSMGIQLGTPTPTASNDTNRFSQTQPKAPIRWPRQNPSAHRPAAGPVANTSSQALVAPSAPAVSAAPFLMNTTRRFEDAAEDAARPETRQLEAINAYITALPRFLFSVKHAIQLPCSVEWFEENVIGGFVLKLELFGPFVTRYGSRIANIAFFSSAPVREPRCTGSVEKWYEVIHCRKTVDAVVTAAYGSPSLMQHHCFTCLDRAVSNDSDDGQEAGFADCCSLAGIAEGACSRCQIAGIECKKDLAVWPTGHKDQLNALLIRTRLEGLPAPGPAATRDVNRSFWQQGHTQLEKHVAGSSSMGRALLRRYSQRVKMMWLGMARLAGLGTLPPPDRLFWIKLLRTFESESTDGLVAFMGEQGYELASWFLEDLWLARPVD